MDIQKENVDFGDYCTIEQKRYGAPNKTYGYKVIGRKKSTSWIDVPVDANNPNPKNHSVLEDVFTAVVIGLDDTTVHQFRVADITKAWQSAKAQAVLEWIDYTKQSPRIDGRYQIFISGEQITADWQSPFGFSDPIEGVALIQELISHWAMLPEPPKAQEQDHD